MTLFHTMSCRAELLPNSNEQFIPWLKIMNKVRNLLFRTTDSHIWKRLDSSSKVQRKWTVQVYFFQTVTQLEKKMRKIQPDTLCCWLEVFFEKRDVKCLFRRKRNRNEREESRDNKKRSRNHISYKNRCQRCKNRTHDWRERKKIFWFSSVRSWHNHEVTDLTKQTFFDVSCQPCPGFH